MTLHSSSRVALERRVALEQVALGLMALGLMALGQVPLGLMALGQVALGQVRRRRVKRRWRWRMLVDLHWACWGSIGAIVRRRTPLV